MKRKRPKLAPWHEQIVGREQQIFEWKVKGKGISWARWCALSGISVHQKGHSRAKDAPRTRPDGKRVSE